ncbi:prepilin peptidase [Escherichia coli]|nr:prepilin peptidase [Escherichia coli]
MYLSMKIVSIVKKDDVVAGGDIALSCATGAWLGVDEVLIFLLISSVIFLIYSIPFRLKGMVFVPMGPALSVGFFICLLRMI